ncbi:MAG: PH domain-containing protein [bacterium]
MQYTKIQFPISKIIIVKDSLLMILLFIAIYMMLLWEYYRVPPDPGDSLLLLSLTIFIVFLLIMLGFWFAGWLKYRKIDFLIDDSSIFYKKNIPFKKIKKLAVEQSLLDRFLGICKLIVVSADKNIQMTIPGLKNTTARQMEELLFKKIHDQTFDINRETRDVEFSLSPVPVLVWVLKMLGIFGFPSLLAILLINHFYPNNLTVLSERQKELFIVLLCLPIIIIIAWKRFKIRVGANYITIIQGVISNQLWRIPLSSILEINTSQTYLETKFNLMTIEIKLNSDESLEQQMPLLMTLSGVGFDGTLITIPGVSITNAQYIKQIFGYNR